VIATGCCVSVQDEAFTAYANREFRTTVEKVTEIIQQQPQEPRWYEMRAQVRMARDRGATA
jgi:hypothetical protein